MIFQKLVRLFELEFHRFSEIGFKIFFMRTADHRDIVLEYWV